MNNKIIFAVIILIAVTLRLFEVYFPINLWDDKGFMCSIINLGFNFDFFECLKENSLAPLHCYYMKMWNYLFQNSSFILKLSAFIPSVLGVIVLYFTGKNYQTKNNSINIGLCACLIGAISSFLIYFSLEEKMYSMIFLLSSLVLLFSIKMYQCPSKKHFIYLSLFSILLILYHTIGFIYVIFNIFGLIAFKIRKKKDRDYFMPVVAGLILIIPLIPFLFRMFAHPSFISQWWSPFNWFNICFLFTDFFSPVLKNITTYPVDFYHQLFKLNSINIGFLMFAVVQGVIALYLIIKSNIDSKRINKYFFAVFLSVFLTVLMGSIVGKLPFLTKFYIELYPLLILMMSIGWVELNSKNTKIALATIYIFMSLFFIIVSQLTPVNLLS